MIAAALYVLLVCSEHIDNITNKQLKIVFPPYPEYFLADDMRNLSDEPFVVVGDMHTDALNYVSKLHRDGDMFTITVGEWELCEKDKRIIKCGAEPELWKIRPVTYGYNIEKDGSCMTFSEEGPVLRPCTMSKRQVVDFKVVPGILQCFERAGNLLEPPATKEERRVRWLLGKKMRNSGQDVLNEISKANVASRSFEEFIKKKNLVVKGKAKEILKNLWDKTHKKKLPGTWKWGWFKLFCP
ncbi:UNVERIFIED_CONTAM: hypothetical protein PYX00_011548 [Menopon gallinae]|uniref:Uncharacterized protein n=1 Tax=Menopon gallinae TaxID=328185 RepID=A0AAW2H828_9NEOP